MPSKLIKTRPLKPCAVFLFILLLCAGCATAGPLPTPSSDPEPVNVPSQAAIFTPTQTVSPTFPPTQVPSPTFTTTPTTLPTTTPAFPALLDEALIPQNAAGLQEVGILGNGILLNLEVAATTGQVAAASHLAVILYDGSSLSRLATLRTDMVNQGMAISPDGRFLAGSRFPNILEKPTSYSVNLLDIQTQTITMKLPVEGPPGRKVFSPTGDLLAVAVGEEPSAITIFDLAQGKPICTLPGQDAFITGLIFSADGVRLYSSAQDPLIHAWDVAGCREAWNINVARGVQNIALSGDGRVLAAVFQLTYDDKRQPIKDADSMKVFIWNSSDGSLLAQLGGFDSPVTAVSLNSGGSLIYVGDVNGRIHVLDETGKRLATTQAHPVQVKMLRLLEDQRLLSATAEELRLADVVTGEVISSSDGYGPSISRLTLSPDGVYLSDGQRVWETVTGRLLPSFHIPGSPRFVLFNADGQRLLAGSENNQIDVYTLADGVLTGVLKTEFSAEIGAISADGRLLAVGSAGAGINLYQLEPFEKQFTLKNSDVPSSITFSPDGKLLIAGLKSGQIRVWTMPEGQLLTTLFKDSNPVTYLDFSSDGAYLFTKAQRFSPRLWNTTTWQLLITYNQGSGRTGFGSDLSPNGQLFAISTMDFANFIKDARDGRTLATFNLGNDICNSVIFSPDGSRVYAAGGFGVVYVYAITK